MRSHDRAPYGCHNERYEPSLCSLMMLSVHQFLLAGVLLLLSVFSEVTYNTKPQKKGIYHPSRSKNPRPSRSTPLVFSSLSVQRSTVRRSDGPVGVLVRLAEVVQGHDAPNAQRHREAALGRSSRAAAGARAGELGLGGLGAELVALHCSICFPTATSLFFRVCS